MKPDDILGLCPHFDDPGTCTDCAIARLREAGRALRAVTDVRRRFADAMAAHARAGRP